MSTGPIETKVKSAAGWAAATGFAVWILETYVFHGVVPIPVQGVLDIIIPGLGALIGGYFAKHTFRNDPDARKANGLDPNAPKGPTGTVGPFA